MSVYRTIGPLVVEIMFKGDKSSFERSYEKQNITLDVISNEIYQTRRRLV